MNYSLIVVCTFIAFVSQAQQPPDFDAVKAAGIVTYDAEKVIKKLKLEDEAIGQQVREHIGDYNMEMYQLLDKHSTTLSDLDALFDRQVKIAMQQRDRSQMNGVKTKIKQVIPPIRQEVMEYERVLNDAMASTLDEKVYAKWLKYQKGKKPSMPAKGG